METMCQVDELLSLGVNVTIYSGQVNIQTHISFFSTKLPSDQVKTKKNKNKLLPLNIYFLRN